MPSAEIITIGTEILLGDIPDTNAQFISRALRDIGLDLFRITTIGDNTERIAKVIQESFERCHLIITTGGLGPTVDDPTREAVARALGVENEYHPELWEQIQARFKNYHRKPTENNKRQAYIPAGARPIENPVGTAPAFWYEQNEKIIVCLPGVPAEMKHLLMVSVLPYIKSHFGLHGAIKSRVIHTAGVGESQIDSLISDLETLTNPTVGLAAHSGQVDIRITAKADTIQSADDLISPLESVIRQRLGKWVYGVDQETLEDTALNHLQNKGWTLSVVESNLGGMLVARLAVLKKSFIAGKVLANPVSPDTLLAQTELFQGSHPSDVGLGVTILPGLEKQEAHIILLTPNDRQQVVRSYGGPPEYAPGWAVNHSLDLLRGL
jgi:competence/damage-inducible protein CinA-like protein